MSTMRVQPVDTVQACAEPAAALRPVHVLHVLPSFYGGGMERATLRLIRGAGATPEAGTARPRLAHGLCVLRDADAALVAQCTSLARIWIFAEGARGPGRLSCWWRLRQVIRHFRPDVVHARSTGVWLDAALATRGIQQVRLMLSFHGKTQTDRPSLKRRLLNRWAAARADAVLTVSAESADYVGREWGIAADKLRVIANGVDVERFCPALDRNAVAHARAELGLRTEDRVVACVANFMPIKGLDVLLRAWPAIVAGQPAARLLLVGDGPLRGELQSLAWKLGCRETVLFAGARENPAELLRAADLFALPSHYEACNNAILEAQASGLPVVACAVGGNAELIADGMTGWLVPPGSPEALTERILAALKDDSTRQQFGRTARAHALAAHQEGAWLNACADLYASLAAMPHASSEAEPCAE